MTTALPAEGTIITKPRGLFIDFRNLLGRTVNDDHIRALTYDFANVARAIAPAQVIKGETLVAEPVPGDKRSEKLVDGGLHSGTAQLRVLRLSFSESAAGNRRPLSASLELDLRDRAAKSASVILHAPDTDAAQTVHDLYDELERLLNKGLLNRINLALTTRDGSLNMSRSKSASSTFTLRF